MFKARNLPGAAGGMAVAVLAAGIAWAAPAPAPSGAAAPPKPMEITGKIRAIDIVNQVIKMENGQYFVVPASIKLSELKEGDRIVLSGDKDEFGGLQVKTVVKAK